MLATVAAQLAVIAPLVIALAGIVMVGGGIVMRMRQDDEGGTYRLVYAGLFLSVVLGALSLMPFVVGTAPAWGPTLVSWIAAIPLHSFLLGILIAAAIIGALYLCNRVLNLLARWITMALFRARRRPHPAR